MRRLALVKPIAWCADYGGSTNCGFHSYDQCRITASGQILGAYATHGTRDAVSTDGGGDEAEFMRHHGPESDAGRGHGHAERNSNDQLSSSRESADGQSSCPRANAAYPDKRVIGIDQLTCALRVAARRARRAARRLRQVAVVTDDYTNANAERRLQPESQRSLG